MVESKNDLAPNASQIDFKISIVKHDVVDNAYAVYLIKVVGPKDISFHIRDRYSSIREFQSMVKKNIESTDGTPNFPKKRFWGNLDADWLELRTRQLSLFLNTFLAHPHVKACKLVPIYFKGKAYGEGSQEAI